MRAQHPNYCRSIIKAFQQYVNNETVENEHYVHVVALAQRSQKFMLPKGGRVLEDKALRALDENEPIRLPFPFIALEYEAIDQIAKHGELRASKRVAFAREEDTGIVMTQVFWADSMSEWIVLPEIVIPYVGFIDRTQVTNGWASLVFRQIESRIPASDYMDEIGSLLCFLNALQCSNVHIERSESKKGNIKTAYPFDSYHVLAIESIQTSHGPGQGTSHRSPREHLRRGHIRRLESGRKIWVNAAVIAAGKGAGKITKDYQVKP